MQSPEATYLRGESKSVLYRTRLGQREQQLEERLIGKGETSPAIAGNDLISARGHEGIVSASLGSSGSKEEIFAGVIGSLAKTESSRLPASNAVVGQIDRSGTHAIYQTITAAYPTEGWPLLAAGPDAQVTAMQFADGTPGESYQFDRLTDAVYPASNKDRIAKYTVSTLQPDLSSVRVNSGEEGTAGSSSQDPAEIMWNYTKLPEGLPARIGKLAGQITDQLGADADRYDKVKAIEAYLRTHYSYTLTDTSVPAAGADFVDQFLFEQKQGYCVHFASAMVVMLRTQGIPARYVKGFAPGEEVGSVNGAGTGGGTLGSGADNGDGSSGSAAGAGSVYGSSGSAAGEAKTQMYTVRASDAHAWVEVYFAGVGWVAFEPTPGFTRRIEPAPRGAASAGQSADAAEQGLVAAGNSAAGGAAAGARGLAGRAAAQLQAAAMRAADAAERGAHALAQAARSAASARPWAMAALAAGATGAAGLAAAAWRNANAMRSHARCTSTAARKPRAGAQRPAGNSSRSRTYAGASSTLVAAQDRR